MVPTHEQKAILKTALIRGYDEPGLNQLLTDHFEGTRLDQVVALPNPFTDIVSDLLTNWVGANNRCQAFLTAVIIENRNEMLTAVCRAILNEQEPVTNELETDPLEDIVLQGWRCFIDRKPTRHQVFELTDSSKPRIMTISGPPKCGKSHCAQYLHHLQYRKWNKVKVACINLSDEHDVAIHPRTLARRLALDLDLADSDPPAKQADESESTWVGVIASWFCKQLRNQTTPCWILLDKFDNPLVPPTTHDFIRALASQVRNRLEHTRLVLTDYNKSVDGALPQRLDYLKDSDIKDFFQRFVTENGEPGEDHTGLAQTLYEQTLLQLPADPTERMIKLGEIISKIIREMLSRRPDNE